MKYYYSLKRFAICIFWEKAIFQFVLLFIYLFLIKEHFDWLIWCSAVMKLVHVISMFYFKAYSKPLHLHLCI